MSAPVYDHGLLTDAIYWDGASKAICAALNSGDLMEVGRLVKHYADLSHAEEVEPGSVAESALYQPTPAGIAAVKSMDDAAFVSALLPRLAIVPVLEVKP